MEDRQYLVRHADNAQWHGGPFPAKPSMLIMHRARGDFEADELIDYLNRVRHCSYNYIIEKKGPIVRMTTKVAWHAGDSAWPNPKPGDGTEECRPNDRHSLNAISIGICWTGNDDEPLTLEQVASGLWLSKVKMIENQIPLSLVLGHYEVSPKRKIDPLPQMPMDAWRQQLGNYLRGAV